MSALDDAREAVAASDRAQDPDVRARYARADEARALRGAMRALIQHVEQVQRIEVDAPIAVTIGLHGKRWLWRVAQDASVRHQT
jgi:hypothetical protein